MTVDLFECKRDKLVRWMREKRLFATHDIIAWGSRNFYNRADRTARTLRQEGIIRKLSADEKRRRALYCRDDVYEFAV